MTRAPETTKLLYQHDGMLLTNGSKVVSVTHVSGLPEADSALLKKASTDELDYAVVTEETIFHVQGGGQPSDTGSMRAEQASFEVQAVRRASDGRVLHFGRFADGCHVFSPGQTVQQAIDADKRLLHSRIHDAGHIVGLAVRQVATEHAELAGLTELKAQHSPEAAYVEFQGLIDGKYKAMIQEKVDAIVDRDLPVEVRWWPEAELREKCVFVPSGMAASEAGQLLRAVDIVGAGAYPCGGTHVTSTKLCGTVQVRKISRSKGVSRVSYMTS
ncbi:Threonyl/alanyl tRNA synthetase SAD [Macrophomina phaseolina MS6]|uniref:Threonyl/alanyl tRNA synthetase SAD n=2 Tax=Macrophomina phaseolina TaxID=35725 RepID=K2QX34_MACPH|nr:Threonyl/alanyl tRNA synthetase SAD [Macrophomina phaseolina MS6]